jgi:hypothetical protein
MSKFPTDKQKFKIVIEKNTFFFHNDQFEQEYEGYITSLIQSVLLLKQRLDTEGLKKEVFIDFIRQKPEGLKAVLALLGLSDESLYRIITFIRASDDKELSKLVMKDAWPDEPFTTEWKETKIQKLAKDNPKMLRGLVNLFFEGPTIPIVQQSLPLFEFKKLGLNKLSFSLESLIDTIIRYKVKGSYNAMSEKNPETLLSAILNSKKILWEPGHGFRQRVGRDMDALIPNKKSPKIFIESSYLSTTSSGMGDKASNELTVRKNIINKYGRDAIFLGFVDGVGWYVRRSDLKTMVKAFHNVFTYKREELARFSDFLDTILPHEFYSNDIC